MTAEMPPLPSIALVTPSFNQAQYVGATVQSVLTQDYPHLDYLIADGASTDTTVSVLQQLEQLHPGRFRWYSRKDAGQSDAIHTAIAQTTGDILGWLNSDDTLAPGALRTVGEFFAANSHIDVLYGRADFIDAAGNYLCPCAHVEPWSVARLRGYSDFIVQPACFFRRKAFDAVGGIDRDLHYAMDYDLWLRLAAGHRFAHIPTVLAHYRWVGQNKSAVGGWGRLNEINTLVVRHHLPDTPAFFRLEAVNMHLQEARVSVAAGRYGTAMASFAKATWQVLPSHRAWVALCQPLTWRVIHTGQILRAAGR